MNNADGGMPTTSESVRLFAEAIMGSWTAAELVGEALQSSCEYSVIIKDFEGRIVAWNHGAELLYRYRAEEVLGRSADLLHAPEDLAQDLPARMRAAAATYGKWEGTISRISKDQLRLTCRVFMTPFVTGDGRFHGFLLLSKDLTREFRARIG